MSTKGTRIPEHLKVPFAGVTPAPDQQRGQTLFPTGNWRYIRPVYRERRDATIAALAALLPDARWQGEAVGLHLYLTLPDHVDGWAVVRTAHERGVLLELGAWHWASPGRRPPSLVFGYGAATEPAIRRGITVIASAIEDNRPRTQPHPP